MLEWKNPKDETPKDGEYCVVYLHLYNNVRMYSIGWYDSIDRYAPWGALGEELQPIQHFDSRGEWVPGEKYIIAWAPINRPPRTWPQKKIEGEPK